MGHRVLVASGETGSTIGSNGSVVAFPGSDTNLWNDRDVTGLHDVKILGSFSASANYKVRLVAKYDDPSSGSTLDTVVEEFEPSGTLGPSGGTQVAFRSDGAHIHNNEWIEIENSSGASSMTVEQLGALWLSHSG